MYGEMGGVGAAGGGMLLCHNSLHAEATPASIILQGLPGMLQAQTHTHTQGEREKGRVNKLLHEA